MARERRKVISSACRDVKGEEECYKSVDRFILRQDLVKATYWRKEYDRVDIVEIRHPGRYKSENGLAQKVSGDKSDRTSL